MDEKSGVAYNVGMSFSTRRLLIAIAFLSIGFGVASGLQYHTLIQVVIVVVTLFGSLAFLLPYTRLPILVFSPFLLLFAGYAGFALQRWDPIYIAEFNAIRSRLEQIPGVVIKDSWYNEDIILEDPWFRLRINNSLVANLHFWDGNEWLGLFEKIEGVHLLDQTRYINGKCYSRNISVDALRENGIEVRTLQDCLQQLDKIVECANTVGTEVEPENLSQWACIEPLQGLPQNATPTASHSSAK